MMVAQIVANLAQLEFLALRAIAEKRAWNGPIWNAKVAAVKTLEPKPERRQSCSYGKMRELDVQEITYLFSSQSKN